MFPVILLLFSIISWTLSLILIFMTHPLSLGLILIMQTMMVSMMTGLLNLDFWFSYILFLIMVGGMLILFIYMTSIASNEKFKFPKKLLMMISFSVTMMMLVFFMDNYLTLFDSMNYSFINQEFKTMNFSMNKFFNSPNMQMLIILMLYLLLTLIIVVKITQDKMSPMRMNF